MELVQAMQLLKEKKQIKLMIIGSTFFANATNDDSFTTELKAKVESLKKRIIFTGFIPYHKMPDYLQMADVGTTHSQQQSSRHKPWDCLLSQLVVEESQKK